MDGYAVTLAQGSLTDVLSGNPGGAYNIWINVCFPQHGAYTNLMAHIKDNGKVYGVLDQFRYPYGIRINLGGSFMKFRAFIAWLMPVIAEFGGERVTKCAICGRRFDEYEEKAFARLQGMAVPAHIHCIDQVVIDQAETDKEDKKIGHGTLGAILGGLLGCIPWIFSYVFGFFIWVFGLIIGLGVSFGYKLAGGRPCRMKYMVILLATVFYVVFCFTVCIVVSVATDISADDLQGGLFENIRLRVQSEYFIKSDLGNGIIGLICALAGCVYLIEEIRREIPGKRKDIRLH